MAAVRRMLVALVLAVVVATVALVGWSGYTSISEGEVAAVKTALPALVAADANLLDQPASATARQAALADPTQQQRIEGIVAQTWDASVASKKLADIRANLTLSVDPQIHVYDQVRVTVDSWNRTTRRGSQVIVDVTLRSPVHRADTQQWDDEHGRVRWLFKLKRQHNGSWKLVNSVQDDLDGQG
jgi:hypothetical protein